MTSSRVFSSVGVALTLALLLMYTAGIVATMPDKAAVGAPPPDWPARTVSFADADGRTLVGWYRPGREGQGTVVLAHGIRSDRRAMLGRARFLSRAGYAVLLFDLQAHGESDGDQITFGYAEARGVTAAVALAEDLAPGDPIAVIGQSLGGAAALMDDEPLAVDALVLEGVYTTLDKAFDNRLVIRFGRAGPLLGPSLMWQVPWRLGYDPETTSPLAGIARVTAPVFLIAGDADRRTTPDDTRVLFAGAPEPKQLWFVAGAGHGDFHAMAVDDYERRVLAFLSDALK